MDWNYLLSEHSSINFSKDLHIFILSTLFIGTLNLRTYLLVKITDLKFVTLVSPDSLKKKNKLWLIMLLQDGTDQLNCLLEVIMAKKLIFGRLDALCVNLLMEILCFLDKINLINYFLFKKLLEHFLQISNKDFSRIKGISEWNFHKFITLINLKRNISEKYVRKDCHLSKVFLR